MKNLFLTFMPALLLAAACAHAPAPGAFRADPEPVSAEGSAPLDERNVGASRERAALDAERKAVRRAAELFMDETSRAEKHSALEAGLLREPRLYVAKRKIVSQGPDGGLYRVGLKVWVYHDKIASALRGLDLAGPGAAGPSAALAVRGTSDASFAAGFLTAFSRRSRLSLKEYPFSSDAALLAGPDAPLAAAAAAAGAEYLFAVTAAAASSGAGLNTGFYPSRSEASLKVYEARTGRELLSLTSQSNAIDSSEAASFSKALASAAELLGQDAAAKTVRLLKADPTIRVKVLRLGGLETAEKLRDQLQQVDLGGLRLESYSGGTAVFLAVPRYSDPQEYASAVLRGDSFGLELEGAGPQEIVFSLPW